MDSVWAIAADDVLLDPVLPPAPRSTRGGRCPAGGASAQFGAGGVSAVGASAGRVQQRWAILHCLASLNPERGGLPPGGHALRPACPAAAGGSAQAASKIASALVPRGSPRAPGSLALTDACHTGQEPSQASCRSGARPPASTHRLGLCSRPAAMPGERPRGPEHSGGELPCPRRPAGSTRTPEGASTEGTIEERRRGGHEAG